MAFVLEIQTSFKQNYIKNIIATIATRYAINSTIIQNNEKIVCAFASKDERLQEALEAIEKELPASLFFKSSKSYENDEEPKELARIQNDYPLNLGLCPTCQKEMFDVSSKRYYYPFTSCSCCGGVHSFVNSYPYSRQNSSFKFLKPCKVCIDEQNSVGYRHYHEINSCHGCGVPVRLAKKKNERYANDAGSFRTLFEVAAKAIKDDKKLLIKTTFGYRLFYKAQHIKKDSIILMINASKITDNLSLITEEFQTLLSIERPVLNVTLKDETLKEFVGANTSYAKYPDEGFTILLAAQLQKLGFDFIAYEEADESFDADMVMDYDLEINPQSDMRVFLNKDTLFIAEGERVSFPSHNFKEKSMLSMAYNLVAMPKDKKMLFDSIYNFDSIDVERVNVLEKTQNNIHSNQKTFLQDEASFISVIAEHNVFDQRCVGAYFDEEPSFLYYDTKSVLRVVPPKEFDGSKIIQDIQNLRDGSDRLIANLQKTKPQIYEKLQKLQIKEDVKLFEAVAILLGLQDESMRGVTKEAMKFIGKGGIQIDTHVKDNRFDHAAFLASIVSYQLAGVSTSIIAYSIFESFGDYFNDILQELKTKTKSTQIILCGTHFANQSLFSRMQRNLKMMPPLMNKCYPIGRQNALVGGVFL